MRFRLSAWVVALSALNGAMAGAQRDSIGEARRAVERELAPLDSSRRAITKLLAHERGAASADSTFWAWYGDYRGLVDTLTAKLNSPMLEVLIDPLGATGQTMIRERQQMVPSSESARQLAVMDSMRVLLAAHGVHAEDAEGEVEYTPAQARIRSEDGRFLSAISQQVLDLLVLEESKPVGGDAAVDIPWAELADRLATADELHARQPLAAADSIVERYYRGYLTAYLGGWDNTPGFAFEPPHTLLPALRSGYARYVRDHPRTRSGRIIEAYIALLREHGWKRTPEVDAFVWRAAP
jgi:hypothetical protein